MKKVATGAYDRIALLAYYCVLVNTDDKHRRKIKPADFNPHRQHETKPIPVEMADLKSVWGKLANGRVTKLRNRGKGG